eukprot:CAMPEP_0201869998 /NCGR_PEP_ID=MMETSP0902-20130614/3286_1 /ASSEMBLY_ACC=CAM_ASM_000551 /TAXON_ID=420261 /ORGANISM="Thalassiosira antarctica, Strain CCMP982" /LENGTH=256 /DNA_ID=CAMNT_0048395567 /DNA_START=107 /DNA_END=877 /DNA_ORIENTATION=+
MATTALCTLIRHTSAFTPVARQASASLTSSSPPPSSTSRRIIHSLSSSTKSSPSFQSWQSSLFSTTEEIDPGIVEGTNLQVLKYPHPSLRAPNEEIPMEDLTGPGSEISLIAKEMFLVMYATQGVGLAAPQVGINKRLMVYNESGDPKKWMQESIMVNPKIVEFSEAKEWDEEGCLSFPDMGGDVERSKWIKVEAQNLKGKTVKKKFRGWEARIFQHEYDHLDGMVYIDRLTEDGRKEVQPKLDEFIAVFGEGGAI